MGFVVGALLGYCFVAGLTPLPNNNLNKQIPVFNLQSVAKFLWNHFLDAFLSYLEILQYLDFNRGDLWFFTVTVNACQTLSFDDFNLHLIHDEFYFS